MDPRLGAAIAALILPAASPADVIPLTGNYFLDHSDGILRRVYNSKTSFKGIFGWNWGTEYETRLTVDADGSIVVRGFGGGEATRFVPANEPPSAREARIDRLVAAGAAAMRFSGEQGRSAYRKSLEGDPGFREREALALVQAGKLEKPIVAEGAVLESVTPPRRTVTRVPDGFQLETRGGTESFDREGRLARIVDRNGNVTRIFRSKAGRIERVAIGPDHWIAFDHDSEGRVVSAKTDDGLAAAYSYNPAGELVSARAPGVTRAYGYAPDGTHGIVSVSANGSEVERVSYAGAEALRGVESFRNLLGFTSRYKYAYRAEGGLKVRRVEVERLDPSGRPDALAVHEYFLEGAGGSERLARSRLTLTRASRTSVTSTRYHRDCGSPDRIEGPEGVVEVVFDSRCRVGERKTPEGVWRFAYDGDGMKPVAIERSGSEKYQLRYDVRENLTAVKTPDGGVYRISYDSRGRPSGLGSDKGGAYLFRYDRDGRVVGLKGPGKIELELTYGRAGEFRSIKAGKGARVAPSKSLASLSGAVKAVLEAIRPFLESRE